MQIQQFTKQKTLWHLFFPQSSSHQKHQNSIQNQPFAGMIIFSPKNIRLPETKPESEFTYENRLPTSVPNISSARNIRPTGGNCEFLCRVAVTTINVHMSHVVPPKSIEKRTSMTLKAIVFFGGPYTHVLNDFRPLLTTTWWSMFKHLDLSSYKPSSVCVRVACSCTSSEIGRNFFKLLQSK